jgi:hypothetical protein
MIFPGMDPYLENPQLWTGVHASLIVYIRDHLQPQLRPRFVAAVEDRVYLEGPQRDIYPDVWVRSKKTRAARGGIAVAEADTPIHVKVPPREVHESYVTILDPASGQKVVTVIEALSPTNKYPGAGRDSYLAKQSEVRQSAANLVEIDLLRAGPHVLAVPQAVARREADYDYLVCVNRASDQREDYELYPTLLRARLPRIKIPLIDGVRDAILDLQAVIAETYERGSYADRIDYAVACRPPLSMDDQSWANTLIKKDKGRPRGGRRNGRTRRLP